MREFAIDWWDAKSKATVAPDPAFPDGRDIDCSLGAELRCTVRLDHPAPGFGAWNVECQRCGETIAVGTTGGADDPRSIKIACQKREPQKSFL